MGIPKRLAGGRREEEKGIPQSLKEEWLFGEAEGQFMRKEDCRKIYLRAHAWFTDDWRKRRTGLLAELIYTPLPRI